MHKMDVAVEYLFYVLDLKWTATVAHEKIELRTVPQDAVQQLT